MALKIPSQRSIDLYNQLVEQQNKVRKHLRKIHKNAEEALGAGRLPALVIPKSAHKVKKSHFQGLSPEKLRARLKAFWQAYGLKKELFKSGTNSYLNKIVVKGYRELWEGEYGINEKPEHNYFGGMYSKEQIENADEDRAKAMRAYNGMFTRGADYFIALLYTNNVVEFKFIYQELYQGMNNKEYSFMDQQIDINNRFSGPKQRAKLMEDAEAVIGDYKHKNKDKKKAKYYEEKDNAKLAKQLGAVFAGSGGKK